jgi:hypothetical protein
MKKVTESPPLGGGAPLGGAGGGGRRAEGGKGGMRAMRLAAPLAKVAGVRDAEW